MKTCKDCEYWCPFEDDPQKGTCSHPERNDKKCVYYYGSIGADSYCTAISPKERKKNG